MNTAHTADQYIKNGENTIQGTPIGKIRGIVNKTDAWKLAQCMLLVLLFFVLVLLLIFTGMFGHILTEELHTQRIQVLEAINHQSNMFEMAIQELHPHFLIESPIYYMKIDKEGSLYIDNDRINNDDELQEFLTNRKRRLRQLEGYYDHHGDK